MDLQELRDYCLSKPGATEAFPFGEDTLVFKVLGKMFALVSVSSSDWVNLKCEPERALELRAAYEEIRPGYHMNKRHWNTVQLDGRLSRAQVEELVDHSFECVAAGLSRATRRALGLDDSR
jgi:predicted DNA-binding protein (MmcQ/YjbR family)